MTAPRTATATARSSPASSEPPTRSGGSTFGGIAPDAGIIAIRQSSNAFRPPDCSARSASATSTRSHGRPHRRRCGRHGHQHLVGGVRARRRRTSTTALSAPLSRTRSTSKNVVVVTAAGNVGGPGQCTEQNPRPDPARPGQPDWDDGEGRGEPVLVRRLRADGRFRRPARADRRRSRSPDRGWTSPRRARPCVSLIPTARV